MRSRERWDWSRSKFSIDWKMEKHLGSGSAGKSQVYKLTRNQLGLTEECAVKIIHLLEEQGVYSNMTLTRQNAFLAKRDALLKTQIEEVSLMLNLRGSSNIVDYFDYEVLDWKDADGFGCDFLIRMELLHGIRDDMRDGYVFSEGQIAKMGYDLSKALVLCHSKNITHRDIKPDNIFVNERNDFKLGDFGISKITDSSPDALISTSIGTRAYGAPEQYHSASGYDNRVDLYSLGLTLYELANHNRLPFAESEYVNEAGIQKRMSGMAFPGPNGVSQSFGKIILKACAYRPEDRYQTAQELQREFGEALKSLELNSSDVYATGMLGEAPYWKNPVRDTRGYQGMNTPGNQGMNTSGNPGMNPGYPNDSMNPGPNGTGMYPDNLYYPEGEVPEGSSPLRKAIIGFVIVDIVMVGFLLGFYILPFLFS